jgi:hypothetical protein
MFCPQCKAEYRDGFSRCSDCDVNLVSELPIPASGPDTVSEEDMRLPYTTHDQTDCVAFCRRLIAAKIPFKVAESNRQYLKGVESNFAIGVPSYFYKEAEEILNQSRLDYDEAPE